MTLGQLSRRLRNLKRQREIQKVALEISRRFSAFLIDLNQSQLSRGLNINGELIGTYSPATEAIAATENTRQPKIAGQPYNFEWTGSLFEGMRVEFTNTYIRIYSTSDNAFEVVSKYSTIFGEEILFGLTSENLREYTQSKLLPELRKYVCQQLGIL